VLVNLSAHGNSFLMDNIH